ncbi:MAG: periplasmic heavy metal sensor [Bdellovibrionales bacterium]|jgi:uncharacterized membrane protein
MKKKHLIIASALLSVIMISGMAQAKTETTPATAAKTTQAVVDKSDRPMRPMMPNLSEAGQKLLQEAMTKERESGKATFEEMQTKRGEMESLLKAATFDKSDYLAKEQELQAMQAKMMAMHAEAFASAAAQMTPEDRAQLANRPHHQMKGGMMQGGKGGMMQGGQGSMMPMKGTDGAAQ